MHLSLFSFNMNHINASLGYFIGRYPWYFFCTSLLVSLVMLAGNKDLKMEKDLRKSFSPRDSNSRQETEAYRKFFNISAMSERFNVLIQPKDGKTMLRPSVMAEVLQLDAYIRKACEEGSAGHNTLAVVEKDGNCGRRKVNQAFHAFQKALHIQEERRSKNESLDPELELNFPNSILYGQRIFVGAYLYGVETVTLEEYHRLGMASTLSHVNAIGLWYFYEAEDTEEHRNALEKLTLLLFDRSMNDSEFETLYFNVYADAVGNREMIRSSIEASRMFIAGFALMFMFVLGVVFFHSVKYESLDRAIFAIVIAAVFSPLLAAGAAFGLLSWFGVSIYSIMCVTPFLVLGIGVDDAFIMLHAWQRDKKAKSKEFESQCDEDIVPQRMAAVFTDVIPSITITSVTNMLAFGIGALTPTPQMSTFCLCTAMAVIFDLILEVTIFGSVLALYGRREAKTGASQIISTVTKNPEKEEKPASFITCYCQFITSSKARAVAGVLLVVLYVISFVGIARMRATFEPYKTFPSDSSLAISLPRAKRIYDEFTPLTIIVNRPPNATEYRRFLNMVDELEAFPTAYGPDRTQLLLRTYEKYDRAAFQVAVDWGEAKPDDYHFNYNNLPNYIKSNKEAFQNDVKFDVDQKGQVTLSSFSFLLVGRQLSEWCERAVFLRNVRGVLARYSDFQALPYDLDASLLDLMLTVKGSLITSSIVTLFCMAAVCVLFIQNKIGVAIVTSAIASICFTLLGLQSWAGADLDPVTMVNMLMAVGFSVDYTAHTVYHYYKGEEQLSPIDRLASTLKAVAWPMIQAGLSTAICMVPLMFLTTYAILAFAKTVFIVVAVGFFHGLFVLPVVLTALPYSFAVHDRCCRRRRNLPAKQYFIDEKLTYNDSEKLSPCTDNLL